MTNLPCILIVEPDSKMVHPYDIFAQLYPNTVELIRYETLNQAEKDLLSLSPVLVLLSCSFSPIKSVEFLEHFKNTFVDQLIPLVFVVDLSKPVSRVLGTKWGKKVGLLHTLSAKAEIVATLNRVQARLPKAVSLVITS
ncbi:hypothetical protein BH10PAT2_BH10PAT2_1740 [soil metagenome]